MSEWKPLERTTPKPKKGFSRLYSWKPHNTGRDVLPRLYSAEASMGSRVCDFYMDVPIVVDSASS